jgi:hypothetical protein
MIGRSYISVIRWSSCGAQTLRSSIRLLDLQALKSALPQKNRSMILSCVFMLSGNAYRLFSTPVT